MEEIKWYKTEFGLSSCPEYEGQPYVINELPIEGSLKEDHRGNATIILQDLRREYSDGSVQIINNYFRKIIPDKGYEDHDICCYCGCSNTADDGSSLRVEWYDCCFCGGN